MTKFHNIQVRRSGVSHFQLLQLNFAPELGSFTSIKNSSLHIHCKHSILKTLLECWELTFCYLFRVKCFQTTVIPEKLFSVSRNFQQRGSIYRNIMWNLYDGPKSQPISDPLSLSYMSSLPLSPRPLQSLLPWAPLLLNNSTVTEGHRHENRFCLCICESVCVCAQTERESAKAGLEQ